MFQLDFVNREIMCQRFKERNQRLFSAYKTKRNTISAEGNCLQKSDDSFTTIVLWRLIVHQTKYIILHLEPHKIKNISIRNWIPRSQHNLSNNILIAYKDFCLYSFSSNWEEIFVSKSFMAVDLHIKWYASKSIIHFKTPILQTNH